PEIRRGVDGRAVPAAQREPQPPCRQQDGGGEGQVQQPAAGPGLGGPGHAAEAAACSPAMRPNTTKSATALPPRRLPPWTPPVTSPAAYRPSITVPSPARTWVWGLMVRPPMVWWMPAVTLMA